MTKTLTLSELRTSAFRYRDLTSAYDWLKSILVVPADAPAPRIRQVIQLDPNAIDPAYLASAAYEWDTWGPASPVDFVRALAAEAKGAKRDLILETLMSLGRASREEAA